MKSEELINFLKKYNKSFYTIQDIQKITGQPRETTRVLLNRLAKTGKIKRLQRNIYVPKETFIDYELIALQYDKDSYVSFETALSRYGILSQISYILTLATKKRSKKLKFGNQEILYRKINDDFFGWGINLKKGRKQATPEQAFLDVLYLMSKGKLFLSLDELDLTVINRKEIKKQIKKYPFSVQKLYNQFN